MRIFAGLCLALWLSACATFQNPINMSRLAQIESVYAVVLSAANGYRTLYTVNRCTTTKTESATNICARRSVVLALQKADRDVLAALIPARRFVRQNPTLDASSLISAVEQAVSVMQQIEQINGVH